MKKKKEEKKRGGQEIRELPHTLGRVALSPVVGKRVFIYTVMEPEREREREKEYACAFLRMGFYQNG